MGNPFVHVELHASDVAKAKRFYGELLSWELHDMPGDMPYTTISVGEGTGGGMLTNPAPGAPSHWMPYIQVANLAASTSRARKLGAKVVQEKTEVPEMGAFTIIADPVGAVVGLWEPAAQS
ncbi:MAG: VOC family protein [Candidatus Lambdaproteobacteria bacterium]|nr:VOC family protein [Candidatus Lambdaproteobacteria bacterium]